jgi:hypothetical protein
LPYYLGVFLDPFSRVLEGRHVHTLNFNKPNGNIKLSGVNMSTKETLSDRLNKEFGFTVDWTKMSKEDLEKILEFIEEPSALIKLGVQKLKAKTKEELLSRPLGDLLQSSTLLGNVVNDRKGGLLGLGVIPRILSRTETKTKEMASEIKSEEPTAEKHEDKQKS